MQMPLQNFMKPTMVSQRSSIQVSLVLGVGVCQSLTISRIFDKTRTGSFSRSFFSLLGILTGTLAWTDHMRNLSSASVYDCDAVDALFFTSFVAIVCIVGFNIVVAVLLEGDVWCLLLVSMLAASCSESI